MQMLKAPDPAEISIRWLRGNERFNFDWPNIFLTLGMRGSGKSVFLEAVAENYLANGDSILDLFGAVSGEGLAWLRSPWVKDLDSQVLLIKGKDTDVQCSWPVKSWTDLTLSDLEKPTITISPAPFFYKDRTFNEEFVGAERVLDLLYSRISWSKQICMVSREASKLLYSKSRKFEDQLMAKYGAIWLLQESRHFGLSMLMDAQKLTSIDADIRALCDWLIFKSQGMYALPREYWFLYRYFSPAWLRSMSWHTFGALCKTGAVGIGANKMIPWHKQAREDLLKILDIRIGITGPGEYEREYKGTYQINDKEHTRLVDLYCDKLSYHKVGKETGRSTATIQQQVLAHNSLVDKDGYCKMCKASGGSHTLAKIIKEELKK